MKHYSRKSQKKVKNFFKKSERIRASKLNQNKTIVANEVLDTPKTKDMDVKLSRLQKINQMHQSRKLKAFEIIEALLFGSYCEKYGFVQGDYGTSFIHDNRLCSFVGFNINRALKPCMVRDQFREIIMLDVQTIKILLNKNSKKLLD